LDRVSADGRSRLIRFGERARACFRIPITAALQGSLHSLSIPPPASLVPGFPVSLCFGGPKQTFSGWLGKSRVYRKGRRW